MPDLNKYNLDSIAGKKLSDIQISNEVQKDAEHRVGTLGKNTEKIAELAFLTRTEIFAMIDAEVKKEAPIIDAPKSQEQEPSRIHPYQKAFENLLQKKSFQTKVAYYKELLELANGTLQKGLRKHATESQELNGDYEKYQALWTDQTLLERQLDEVMTELFSERGHDPDSMLVETRKLLEEGLKKLKQEMDELSKKNPDIAAFLQYEKIKQYSEELEVENGFAWTESRKRIVKEALARAMASRPLILLMGETGTGKTAIASALSKKLTGMKPEREVGGKDYRLRDLLGSRAMDPQHGSFLMFGPLLRAMSGMESSLDKSVKNEGGVYFDDEFNSRPPDVQKQILKFVAEAKPGQRITVPGTEIRITVRPKFLYLAAGNPNNGRYETQETPVEAYREFSGVLDVDYLNNTKKEPELMEVMVAALMDQKTRRLRVVSKEEVMPNFVWDDSKRREVLNEMRDTGGFLWRFSLAWKDLLQAYAHQTNILHMLNPSEPAEKYHIEKFILDLGQVRDWLHQYKVSGSDQRHGIEVYLRNKIQEKMATFPPEDRQIVVEMMRAYGIDLSLPPSPPTTFTSMTPKEIGYLFPNVQRPVKKSADKKPVTQAPEPPPVDIGEDGEDLPGGSSDPNLLKGKPSSMTDVVFERLIRNAPGLNPMETSRVYNAIIDALDGYSDSYAVAKEIDPTVKTKSREEILANIWALGVPMLREIAQFNKPTLLITPQNDLVEKVAKMNGNKRYKSKPQNPMSNPQMQDDAFVWNDPASPYRTVADPNKTLISIVDGAPHMPHISGIERNSKFDKRKELFKKHFKNKGMNMINTHEYAVLMQRSLNEYKKHGNDESKIVDYYVSETDTVNCTITCLDDQYLSRSSGVACGCFDADFRQVFFHAGVPDGADADLRGRPSVQVMEY